ncbi:hypothetical protein HAX54_000361 [Datura stramonium]|uniref:Uncharacterized protein n=1 Tax=Datura stramonium TaxID=4076 RepID=A0ABS8WSJ8_DATST|nr:hypothetical protein [Datura stramonium]
MVVRLQRVLFKIAMVPVKPAVNLPNCLRIAILLVQKIKAVDAKIIRKQMVMREAARERSCPGLLVSILEVLEDLGLNIKLGFLALTRFVYKRSGERMKNEAIINAQVVTEAVFETIKNWSESNEQG